MSVKELLSHNLDLLIMNEAKLDDSFPKAQFRINGYKCLRKDRNIFGGGLSLINEDFPSKQIHIKQLKELESMFIENFLSGLSFTNIRDSQDNRGERGTFYKFSLLLPLVSQALRHYLDLDIGRTIGRLLQRTYLRTLVPAGLEPGTFVFRAQVTT